MQVDSPDQIRNITLAGHADTGKTTVASALLYAGGAVNRMQRVEDGNTTTDFDEQEIERGNSISLGPCFAPWRKHKVNIVDAPGSGMFEVESRISVRATDATVIVVNAVSGVEVATERMWKFAESIDQPVAFHINKMDRDNADVDRVFEALNKFFGAAVVPLHFPLGKEHDFEGVVDLVDGKAYRYETDGDGKAEPSDPPGDLTDAIEEWRSKLIEGVAETDDDLMERYFEEGSLSPEELKEGLRKALAQRKIFPVTLGSALHGIGSSRLLDTIVDYLPSPTERGTFPATDLGGEPIEIATADGEPISVLCFKTLNDPFSGKISVLRVAAGELSSDTMVWNTRAEENEKVGQLLHMQGKQGTPTSKLVVGDIGGVAKLKHTLSGDTVCAKERPIRLAWVEIRPPAISFAIEPKSKGDEEKISDALHRMMEEDLGLVGGRDPQTHEVLLSGAGQLHVELAVAKLHSRFHVDVILHPPKVPYHETIRRPADGHGRHKKQTGGRGQFADCSIKIEPLKSDEDFEFVDEIFGGAIPQGFRPAVEKGIQEARQKGYLAGYPVADFRVRLVDGRYHDVDSSEMAFKVAGSMAWKDAMAKAAPVLLEPIMAVDIRTSEDFMGDVMGDLSQRRGKPQGMEAQDDRQIIKATVPMSEMLDYARSLRAMTQGRSSFTMEFSHYEMVPKQIQDKLIADSKKADED
ncbi:MAG: elongation factor G [bacterium]|nr:elongation factor G [bacterium]